MELIISTSLPKTSHLYSDVVQKYAFHDHSSKI